MLSIDDAGNAIAAVGALGTAAYGLVDVTKVFGGGVSRAGFGHIRHAVDRFLKHSTADGEAFGPNQVRATLLANWMNGMAKADQKAAAKSLIRAALKPINAAQMARVAGVNPDHLSAAAQHAYANAPLSPEEMNALGAFDVAVSATLDLGYERGDQLYRNAAKMIAAVIAVVLALAGAVLTYGIGDHRQLLTALLIGLVATPLAPVAKDITSALQTAAQAMNIFKR
jgi:hypothetical protein